MAKTRSLSDLAPNPKNPRRITDKKLAMLGESLRRFGDLSGVCWNRESGQLIGGHQRLKAFADMKGSVVITKAYDTPTATKTVAEGYVDIGGERFAYREVSFDQDEEKAANLAANASAGDFELPMVAEWMQELEAADFDLSLTMFDADDRSKLTPPTEFVPSEEEPPRLDQTKNKMCPSCGYEF